MAGDYIGWAMCLRWLERGENSSQRNEMTEYETRMLWLRERPGEDNLSGCRTRTDTLGVWYPKYADQRRGELIGPDGRE